MIDAHLTKKLESGDHLCALSVSQTGRDQIALPFLRLSRITGEMPRALQDLPDEREEFFRYEAELNRFAPEYPPPDPASTRRRRP